MVITTAYGSVEQRGNGRYAKSEFGGSFERQGLCTTTEVTRTVDQVVSMCNDRSKTVEMCVECRLSPVRCARASDIAGVVPNLEGAEGVCVRSRLPS